MTGIDWAIVVIYMGGSMAVGLYLARRALKSLVDFFVGGRSLPWWLAGTSMAATTFSIDTPLYVAGVTGTRGIAGNWEWWAPAISHVILIYIFARMWRRAEILTDNELTELRYGGRPAATLRAVKGFLFAVVIGSIGIGYAMLAMVKAVDALQIFPSLGLNVGASAKLWGIILVSVLVLMYAGVAGLWGVVATDLFQFVLALVGALLVAGYAVSHAGGLLAVREQAQALTSFDMLSFTPLTFGHGHLVGVVQSGGDHGDDVLLVRHHPVVVVPPVRWRRRVHSAPFRRAHGAGCGESGVVLQHHAVRGAHLAVDHRGHCGGDAVPGSHGP